MTVEEFLQNFLIENINLRKICVDECDGTDINCDICKVTSKHKKLAENLKKQLKVLPTEDEENQPSTFLTGSYRRHTMIRPPKDVDFFVVLDSGEYQDDQLDDLISPKKLLNKLRTTLEDIFENDDIEIEPHRHSVTVVYDETFSIDVIPAFETNDKKAYMIADVEEENGDGRYIISNPKIHYKHINDINVSTAVNKKKRFKKVVRLIKFIKKSFLNEGKIKIRSFHFELLAAKILGKEKIYSYSKAIRDFFSEAHKCFDEPSMVDPANPDNMIDDYLEELSSETKEDIKNKIKEIQSIAQKAVDYEDNEDQSNAIKEWEKIFKDDEKKAYELAQSIARSGTVLRATTYEKKPVTTHKPWST